MVKIIPYLSLKKEDYDLNLFEDPFLEDFKCKKSGLYLIGDCSADFYLQFSQDLPKLELLNFTGMTLTQQNTYFVEFDIYASPDGLDCPLAKPVPGVLHQAGFNKINNRWLKQTARFYGASWLESLFVPWKVDRATKKALKDPNNRRNLGKIILMEYQSRKDNPDSLGEVLRKYEEKEEREGIVIPISKI